MNEIAPAEVFKMASAMANSGLFGVKTSEQAFALMMIAQAEGSHPAIAIRDYHVIQGKPALKADAMLARFQQAGGSVKWGEYTDEKVSGTFSHPAGGTVDIVWTMKDAERIGLAGKDNWRNYPRAMMRARCISEGVRTVYPGCVVGTYTPEEVSDFTNSPLPASEGSTAVQVEPEKTTEEMIKEMGDGFNRPQPDETPRETHEDAPESQTEADGDVEPAPEDTPLTCGFKDKKPIKKPVGEMSDQSLQNAHRLAVESVAKGGRWKEKNQQALARIEIEIARRGAEAPANGDDDPSVEPESEGPTLAEVFQIAMTEANVNIGQVTGALMMTEKQVQDRLSSGEGFQLGDLSALEGLGMVVSGIRKHQKGAA